MKIIIIVAAIAVGIFVILGTSFFDCDDCREVRLSLQGTMDDRVTFNAEQGSEVSLLIKPRTDGQTGQAHVSILDTDGLPLAFIQINDEKEEVSFIAPHDGTYIIKVESTTHGFTLNYLTIRICVN